MTLAESDAIMTMPSPVQQAGDGGMVGKVRWEEIRRLFYEERRSIARIARILDLDCKTVRRCVRCHAWQPYRRAVREERLLAEHEGFMRVRAPEVCYSARILYQELRCRDLLKLRVFSSIHQWKNSLVPKSGTLGMEVRATSATVGARDPPDPGTHMRF